MKKLLIATVTLLLTIGLSIKSESQNLSESQKEQIKKEVDAVFQKMIGYAEDMDYDKLTEGVDDNNKVGFITNGKYYTDYATLLQDVKAIIRGVDHQDITIKTKKLTVLSDNNVLLTASGEASAKIDDGRVITALFNWSFVYQKINNSWKVIYSHQSQAK